MTPWYDHVPRVSAYLFGECSPPSANRDEVPDCVTVVTCNKTDPFYNVKI